MLVKHYFVLGSHRNVRQTGTTWVCLTILQDIMVMLVFLAAITEQGSWKKRKGNKVSGDKFFSREFKNPAYCKNKFYSVMLNNTCKVEYFSAREDEYYSFKNVLTTAAVRGCTHETMIRSFFWIQVMAQWVVPLQEVLEHM